MIRLALIADIAAAPDCCGITGSNPDRRNLLPEPVSDVMRQVLYSENIALSRNAFSMCRSLIFAFYDTFVFSHDVTFMPSAGCMVCNDPGELIKRFHDSPEELLVMADVNTFSLFLPYASSMDVVDTDIGLTCNAIFDRRDDENFSITSGRTSGGVRILHYERRERLTS